MAKKQIKAKKSTAPSGIPAGRPGIPNPIDVHVGHKLRERRTLLGLSQTQMADTLGITFQQVQKYEKGTNRISASRLVDLANVLDVEITFFFDSMPSNVLKQSPRKRAKVAETPVQNIADDPMTKRETLTLVRAYYKIKDEAKRKSIITLCKSLGEKK
ncbi:MAG: helix-turn-helix domain-containing protein [Alphaproteobacteria bacterium]